MSHGNPASVFKIEARGERRDSPKNKKISVCHLASGDLWAGAEAQLSALIGALACDRDFRVCAILLNEGRLAEEIRKCGVDVKIISESQKGFWQILGEATRYLRRRNTSILHSHRYKENLLATFLAWRCQVPFLVRTQHGMAEPFRGLKRYRQGLMGGLDWIVARWADRVVGVSQEMRSHLSKRLGVRKVCVIQNGLATERVHSYLSPPEAKRRLGIHEDFLVVGTAGRLAPIKRLDLFLAAAARVVTNVPRTMFVIAGEGSEEARLRELARHLGLQERVLFLGHRQDLYDVLRAFDVFVLSSDHEGLPMVLLESLYLGIPVVARAVGGIPEVIQHGIQGILVESAESSGLAEACSALLTDDSQRKRMALAGTSHVVEHFTAERNAAELARVYHSLCGVR